MKQNSSIRVILWFTICNIITKGVVFFCTPFYTRMLDADQYGNLSLWHSWDGIITAVVTLNLYNSGYTAGLTHYSHDEDRYSTSMVGLNICLCTIGFSIVFFVPEMIYGGVDKSHIMLLFFRILGFSIFCFWSSYERYHLRYVKLLEMVILEALLIVFFTVIIPIFFTAQQLRLDIRIKGEVLAWTIVGFICFISFLKKNHNLYNRTYWQTAFASNFFLIPHYLSATILNQADRIMIGKYCRYKDVAYYSLAYTISSMMLVVSNAVKNAYDPIFFQSLKRKDIGNVKETLKKAFMLMLFFTFMVIIVAPEFIYVLAPKDYANAINVIPALASSVFLIFTYGIYSVVGFYYGKSKHIMMISVIGATVNIALNLWLIPIFGYIAAGYTTLVSYFVFSIGHYVLSNTLLKSAGMANYYDKKFIIIMYVSVFMITVLGNFVYHTHLIRYILFFITIMIIIIYRNAIIGFFMKENSSSRYE